MAIFNMVKDNTDSLCSSSCDTPPLHPLLAAIFKMVIGHREGKGEGGTTSGCEKVSPSALPTHETTRRLPEEGEGKPGGRLPHSCTTMTTVPPSWQGTYGKVVGVVPVVDEDVEAEA